jgi:hypothetical protein
MFSMEVVIERECGMDVHKDNITACILIPEGKEIQTFSTKKTSRLDQETPLYSCYHGEYKCIY